MSTDDLRPDRPSDFKGPIPYNPRHIDGRCLQSPCQIHDFQDSTTSSITKQYQQDRLPLISYVNDMVELLSDDLHSVHARRYVAISHVRSQGLGNSFSNSLPMCQISRLQSLVDRLYPKISGPVPFWIDTLFIPLTVPGQYLALEAAYNVYRRADATIVLDESIVNTPTGSAELNMGKIKESQWAQRLWTICEGAVAKSLKVQFKDSALDMRDMIGEYSSAIKGSLIFQNGSQNHVADGIINRKSVDSFIDRLRLLERDLRAAMDKIPPPLMSLSYKDLGEYARTERKNQIRVILRHCYLSVPLYRYFLTEQDAARFVILRATIDATYRSLTYDALLKQQKTLPAETLERLETVRLRGSVAAD